MDSHRKLRVARVSLDHHRATCSQSRRGVATEYREGEGEVAGGEHRHRPQWALYTSQLRAPTWRCTGNSLVHHFAMGCTCFELFGEAAQLKSSTGYFTVEPAGAEMTFFVSNRYEIRL